MHVLIVEDNAFNAFCLTRLLQASYKSITISVANNSVNALNFLAKNTPSLAIIDGDLSSAQSEIICNGPELVEKIWVRLPFLPIIAWTNCEIMRKAFADVFQKYHKPFNDYCWTKIVNHEKISHTLNGYIGAVA